MSRVLVTGGAGTIGAAVVRRLLADPAYEVRVSDQRPAPQWMRESCAVHTGDLRERTHAGAALGLRILEAHGGGVLPRRGRGARAPVHDLPPVQRVWSGRAPGPRAGHRACGARPDPQGPLGAAPAADLRLGRADADADARR